MTTTNKLDRDALVREEKVLAAREILVETNEGTYSGGDPAFRNRNVWERVGDAVLRVTGPSENDAPGYMRRLNAAEMSSARKRLAEVRGLLRDSK